MNQQKREVLITELYKLYKRKDTWIFLSVILVPFLYAVGIATNSKIISYSGNGNITALNFVSAMFQMAQSMFIFNILLVAITNRTLGTEIEDKSLRIYLNKIGDRKELYIKKVNALMIYTGVMDMLLISVGVFCYYFILNGKTDIVNGTLYDQNWTLEITKIITICAFWILTIFITMMLSIKFKLVVCIAIYMLGYIIMNLISYIEALKYISPLYYVSSLTAMAKMKWTNIGAGVVYFILVIIISSYFGITMFKRKDI